MSCSTPLRHTLKVPQLISKLSPRSAIKCGVKTPARASGPILVNTPQTKHLLHKGLPQEATVLGKGAFGVVFSGIFNEKPTAVKLIRKKDDVILREKNALQLDHENIIKVLQIIEGDSSSPFGLIIMEKCTGNRTLQNFLSCDNKNTDLKTTLEIAIDIAEALAYCHGRNILHLDVKPRNVLISEDGRCKLCDFGNSLKLDDCNQLKNFSLGTITHTCPEMLTGSIPTPKADVYSYGITLWQIETHKEPYEGLRNETIIFKVVRDNLRPHLDGNGWFRFLYTKCWLQDAQLRPDMNFLRNCLREMKT